jgi:hypothetical protein
MADLAYPDIPPPSGSNHLFGRYVPGPGNTPEEQRENRRWVLYDTPITTYQLPTNVAQTNQHWTDITRHDGTYVDRSGQSHKPGTPGHPGLEPPLPLHMMPPAVSKVLCTPRTCSPACSRTSLMAGTPRAYPNPCMISRRNLMLSMLAATPTTSSLLRLPSSSS